MSAHNFKVRGRTPFPLDMLRHDECWPEVEEDVVRIEQSRELSIEALTVSLETWHSSPTVARWASFGWEVLL